MMDKAVQRILRDLAKRDPLLQKAHGALAAAMKTPGGHWTAKGFEVTNPAEHAGMREAMRRYDATKVVVLRELAEATKRAIEALASAPPRRQ